MNDKRLERFTPDEVDEQIKQLSFAENDYSPGSRLVHSLYELGRRDERIIRRARERLQLHLDQERPIDIIAQEDYQTLPSLRDSIEHENRGVPTRRPSARRRRAYQLFSTLAAILIIGVLIGSFAFLFNVKKEKQEPSATDHSYVYVTRFNGVYKIDPQNGQTIWKYPVNSRQWNVDPFSSALNEQYFFFTANDFSHGSMINTPDYIFALDSKKGSLVWKEQIGTGNTPVRVAGDVLYIYTGNVDSNGISSRMISAYSAKNGAVLWTRPTHGGIALLGPVQDHKLYVTENNYIYALDVSNGQTVWSQTIGQVFAFAPQVVDGRVYGFACSQEHVICIHYTYDAGSGDLPRLYPYTAQEEQTGLSGPTIADDKLYQASSSTGEVYALNLRNEGQELWHQQVGQSVSISPVVAGDTVYISGSTKDPTGGDLVALNTQDGSQRWSQSIPDASFQQIVIDDGLLYCSYLGDIQVRSAGTGELVRALSINSPSNNKFPMFMIIGKQ